MDDQVTDMAASDLEALAAKARQALAAGVVSDEGGRSVSAALTEYGMTRQALSEHGETCPGDMVVSVPTLALDWIKYAANLADLNDVGEPDDALIAPVPDGETARQREVLRQADIDVVGTVAVDSGTIAVVDPATLAARLGIEWHAVEDALYALMGEGLAVISPTASGDGMFTVDEFTFPLAEVDEEGAAEWVKAFPGETQPTFATWEIPLGPVMGSMQGRREVRAEIREM